MKKILLASLSVAFFATAQAQKTDKKITAYAITGVQKGAHSWTEVRLIDVATGEELQTVYTSAAEAEILNARTGKPVVKKDATPTATPAVAQAEKLTPEIIKKDNHTLVIRKVVGYAKPQYDQPFATTSAACAYDKKYNRLYYTPMGIAQLRYIDLKAKTPKVYFFEDEAFGVVKGRGDVASQITRMVIAADGNGYALSNDANHLIRFTIKKKPEITDLGGLNDDLTNGSRSVHSSSNFGGDMIADKEGNIWLIGANRSVYKIDVNSRQASYVGSIKGLPRGFSTNGAIAEGDSKVIVSSSSNTEGYYHFDLNTLQAERISNGGTVFNASDLANATFAFEKKKKDEPKPIEEIVAVERIDAAQTKAPENNKDIALAGNGISVYPNPVRDGYFKLSFAGQKPGRYQVQLLDVAGKIVGVQQANIANKVQVEEFRLPLKVAAGNYLVRVTSEDGTYTNTSKVIVQ